MTTVTFTQPIALQVAPQAHQPAPVRKVCETRFYHHADTGGQALLRVNFITLNGRPQVEINDGRGNEWHESNFVWLLNYFPEIVADVVVDPLMGWR